jgi:hypothetical protein
LFEPVAVRGVYAEKIGNLFKKIRLSELRFFVLCVEFICGGMCELSLFLLIFFQSFDSKRELRLYCCSMKKKLLVGI